MFLGRFAVLLLIPFLLGGCAKNSKTSMTGGTFSPNKAEKMVGGGSAHNDELDPAVGVFPSFLDRVSNGGTPNSTSLEEDKAGKELAYYYFSHLREQLYTDLPYVVPDRGQLPVVLNKKVKRYIKYFQTRGRKSFSRWLSRSGKYTPMMREVLEKRGLPSDFVYLAMIESGFNVRARSNRGAVGPWQFIRPTARKYGLRVDFWVDERIDPVKSTGAAADYLLDLYNVFQDWQLAAAGYNAGERRVRRAMYRTKKRDYWEISRRLPRETKNYIPKLIAALLISKNPEKYGFEGIEYQNPDPFDVVSVPPRKSLKDIARLVSLDYKALHDLNPSLIAGSTPPGDDYLIYVPAGYGGVIEEKAEEIAALRNVKRTFYVRYRVRRGDTLSGIARRYRVRVSSIRRANHLRGSLIRAGKVLRIPSRTIGYASYASRGRKTNRLRNTDGFVKHVVRKGESPYKIARSYGVGLRSLMRENPGVNPRRLRPGQVLLVPIGNKARSAVLTGPPPAKESVVSYRIKRGDSLWKISRLYRVSVKEIKRWNKLRTNRLIAGDTLRIYVD